MAWPAPLSPLRLSASVYSWDDAVTVTFDPLQEQLLHLMSDGLYSVSVGKGSPVNALFVSFSAFGCTDWVQDVRIAPNGKHMCIHGQPDGNACSLWINNVKTPSYKTASAVMFKKGGTDVVLLQMDWLESGSEAYDDLVVVTTAGIEVFRVSYDPVSVKSLRWHAMNIRLAWTSPKIVMVCIGTKTLQPMDMRSSRAWLPKFDLYIQHAVMKESVDLVTLYGMAFCVHLDHTQQRLSLRNVSEASQSAPEYDVVIDLSLGDLGFADRAFRVAVCDNLLIVHDTCAKPSFWLYDIRSPLSSLWESNIELPVADKPDEAVTEAVEFTSFFGRWVVDSKQQLRSFELDMTALRLHLRKKRPLHEVLQILSRRSDCRSGIMFELREALMREDLDKWQRCCTSLTSAYRSAIEDVAQNSVKADNSQRTVSLSMLMAAASNLSILSEKDLVMNVFLPHLIEQFPQSLSDDGENLLLRPLEQTDEEKAQGYPIRAPYFVLAVTGYMRSLLNKNILPHRMLQGFVFDILVIFRQEHLLQQMLHNHVLIDSEDLLSRLRRLALDMQEPWVIQACQDMGQRLRDFHLVTEVLLGVNFPFQALAFVMSRQLIEYPLRNIFAQLEQDDIHYAVLEVKNWMAVLLEKQNKVPNLEGCEHYFE